MTPYEKFTKWRDRMIQATCEHRGTSLNCIELTPGKYLFPISNGTIMRFGQTAHFADGYSMPLEYEIRSYDNMEK